MSKKRNRGKRQNRGDSAPGGAARSKKKKGGLSGTSLAFIGVILLAAVAIGIAMAFSDRPECPPGQVWSEAHNHCH